MKGIVDKKKIVHDENQMISAIVQQIDDGSNKAFKDEDFRQFFYYLHNFEDLNYLCDSNLL